MRRRPVDPLDRLPFVRPCREDETPDGRTRHFWSPPYPGGDYQEACYRGSDHALALVRHMRDAPHRATYLLGWAVKDMPKDPDLVGMKGLQVGFLSTFAELAVRAAGTGLLAGYEADLERHRALWRVYCAPEEAA